MGFWSTIKNVGSALASATVNQVLPGFSTILSNKETNASNTASTNSTNATNLQIANDSLQMQKDTLDYQKYYDANKYSIMAQDLENSGLSKTLMAGNTGSSSVSMPSGASANQYAQHNSGASVIADKMPIIDTLMSYRSAMKSLEQKDAEIGLLKAQTTSKQLQNVTDSKYLDPLTKQNLTNSVLEGARRDTENKILGKDYQNYWTRAFMQANGSAKDVGLKALEGALIDHSSDALDYLQSTSQANTIQRAEASSTEKKRKADMMSDRIKKINEDDNKTGKSSVDANKRGKRYTDYYKKYYN